MPANMLPAWPKYMSFRVPKMLTMLNHFKVYILDKKQHITIKKENSMVVLGDGSSLATFCKMNLAAFADYSYGFGNGGGNTVKQG